MPTIRNRTRQVLNLPRIGRHLDPGESVEVAASEAAALAGHPLLDIDQGRKPATKKEGEQE